VTPAVDSRHAGAKMSDADFAKLQADRDAAPRGAQKANLHKRVQNEIARRKAGSTPAETSASRRDGGSTRDATEQKVAQTQWDRLGASARKHLGMVGPQEGGAVEVHFPNANRASGFYDQMTSAFMDVEYVGSPFSATVVRVRRP
jgi:hypothetical protein